MYSTQIYYVIPAKLKIDLFPQECPILASSHRLSWVSRKQSIEISFLCIFDFLEGALTD